VAEHSTTDRATNLGEHAVYRYLEPRPHPWRRQWSLKGRNMTVGQLVYSMRANGMLDDPQAAARTFDLPVEQVREALDYFRRHRALIAQEANEEKRRLIEAGYSLEPKRSAPVEPLSR
jgi:uncharacterized protein (DUF433 family)